MLSPGCNSRIRLVPRSNYSFCCCCLLSSLIFALSTTLGYSRDSTIGSCGLSFLVMRSSAGDTFTPEIGLSLKLSKANCKSYPSSKHFLIICFNSCTNLSLRPLLCAKVGLEVINLKFHIGANCLIHESQRFNGFLLYYYNGIDLLLNPYLFTLWSSLNKRPLFGYL